MSAGPARDQEAPATPEPDYRFTLANERTFLAWMRTSLALLAAAVALVQLAPDLGSRTFREACGLALAALATGCAGGGLWRWVTTQRAITEGRTLPHGPLPAGLALGLTAVAVAVVLALVVELL